MVFSNDWSGAGVEGAKSLKDGGIEGWIADDGSAEELPRRISDAEDCGTGSGGVATELTGFSSNAEGAATR